MPPTRVLEPLRMPPLNALQLLDACIRMYRENFLLFVAISMLPTVPFYLMQLGVTLMNPKWITDLQTPHAVITGDQMQALAYLFTTSFIFIILIYGFGMPIATGALTTAVSNRYLGEPISVTGAFRPMFRNLGKYLLTSMLVALIFGVSYMCTCSILLWFTWVWFLCTPCVLILERTFGVNALRRSRELARGHWWRLFGASLWMFVVLATLKGVLPLVVVSLTVSQVESPVLHMSLQQSIAIVISTVVDPLWSIFGILVYYDLRIRKEGYDLAINAHRLAGTPPLE